MPREPSSQHKSWHVRAEAYELCRLKPAAGGYLARLIHDHRLALCAECRTVWERLAGLQGEYIARLEQLHTRPLSPQARDRDGLSGSLDAIEAQRVALAALDKKILAAKNDFWELGRTPPGERRRKILRAHCRFRSRALVELLIDKCRTMVRTDPKAAAELASLVPLVLRWTEGPDPPRWAPSLLALAEAQRGNALRVGGDLRAAKAVFLELRRTIGRRPLGDARILGEIASLEASLCMAQQRFEEADEFLERAASAFAACQYRVGLAKVRIQQGNLKQAEQDPEAALRAHEAAAEALSTSGLSSDPYLLVCAVTGRANALCDLDRPAAASELLEEYQQDFEACDEPHVAANLRGVEGRVHLGCGRWQIAARSFADAGIAMNALGRHYDAAVFALFEAEAYHRAGHWAELQRLAGPLVRVLQAQGVVGEALRALHLFRAAVRERNLTAQLFTELRRRIVASQPAASPRD